MLRNGQEYIKIQETEPVDLMKRLPGQCFKNAFELMGKDVPMKYPVYVEGYATFLNVGFPMLHAWCVSEDGWVLDPTWSLGMEYFGIAFNPKYVIKTCMKRKCYGIIDNWEERWPLLTGKHKEKKWKWKDQE